MNWHVVQHRKRSGASSGKREAERGASEAIARGHSATVQQVPAGVIQMQAAPGAGKSFREFDDLFASSKALVATWLGQNTLLAQGWIKVGEVE